MINLEISFLLHIKKKSWSCTKVELAITMLFFTGTFPKTWAIQSCSGHLLFMPAKKPFPFLLKWSPELIWGKRLLHNHATIHQDVSISPGQGIGMWPELSQSDVSLSLEFEAHVECGERWKKQLEPVHPIWLWLSICFHFPHRYFGYFSKTDFVSDSSILQYIPLCLLDWIDFCFLHL